MMLSRRLFSSVSSTNKLDPLQLALMSERCLLVSPSDVILGSSTKHDCHRITESSKLPPLHRAFSLFLFNSKSELLFQQRSSFKITFPDLWTNTCCSHPLLMDEDGQVEGVEAAARRRVKDELGIELNNLAKARLVARILYGAVADDGQWGEHELDHVLVLQEDVEFHINENEVQKAAFVGQNKLDHFMKERRMSPWFQLIHSSGLLNKWWNNLHDLDAIADVNTIVDLGVLYPRH